jgi:hypothetical protein
MAVDSVLQAYDDKIAAQMAKIDKQKALIASQNYWDGQAQSIINKLSNNSNDIKTYYDNLQNWNKTYFDKAPQYFNGDPNAHFDDNGAALSNAWKDLKNNYDNVNFPKYSADLVAMQSDLQTMIDDRTNYYNNLPAAIQANLTNASNAALLTAQAAAQNAIAATKTAVQGTTKYLIIGAIALVVIAIGVYFLRKKFAA